MNVLLLSMPDIHPSFHPSRIGIPGGALYSLAGNLEKRHHVRVGDLALKRRNVKKAVIEALKKTNPDLVGLSAMTFQYDSAVRIARFIEICDAIIESGNNDLYLGAQVSCRGIANGGKLTEKMAQAGFKYVFLGIENINEKNLHYLRKGDKTEVNLKAIKLLKKYNIIIAGGIIIGNPDDKAEDIEANYRFLNENSVDLTLDQVLTPYLKTEIRAELSEKDLITNHKNYKFYNGFFANVKTNHLSSEEISYYKWKYYMKYMNTAGSLRIFNTDLFRHYWGFIVRRLPFELVRQLASKIMNLFKSEQEKFQIDMEKNLKLNKFDI